MRNLLMVFAFSIAAFSISAVAQPATTTTLAVTSGTRAVTTVASGTVVTLTAMVQEGSTLLTPGLVKFCDATATYCTDIHMLASVELTKAGTATYKFRPGVGSHSYKAVFVGTGKGLSSSSASVPLTVTHTGPYATTTSISQSGSVGNYSLVATTGGMGDAPPTGTISFVDTTNNNATLGTSALTGGTSGLGFVNSSNPATVVEATTILTADFNGDGIPDLAVLTYSKANILLGNGDGTFTVLPAIAIGEFTVVGDFNGDGIPDLAFVEYTDEYPVTILLGNGDGTFTQTASSPSEGKQITDIAVGDFNGDGIQDLALAQPSNNSITILLGNGDGTFKSSMFYLPSGTDPGAIVVGDFNGDGILDLAVSGANDELSMLFGYGDGTFRVVTDVAKTGSIFGMLTADVNGDGFLDLVGIGGVLLGNGNGSFTLPATGLPTGIGLAGVAIGDFNGDGILDLAGLNTYDSAAILLGNGDGTFTLSNAVLKTGNHSDSIVATDFNGDGISDVATANFLGTETTSTTVLLAVTQTATATVTGIAEPIATGSHQVVANYAGDTGYLASTSFPAVLSSAQSTPTVSVAFSANPSVFGAKVTISATVTGVGSVPTGTVYFYDENGLLGKSVMSNGVAAYPTSALETGLNSINVIYSGDDNYLTVTTALYSLTVNQATPAITWATPAAITYGTALGATQLDATSTVAGAFAYTPTAGTVLTPGSQTLSVTLTPTDTTDYTTATATVTLTVKPDSQTITFAALPAVTYGAAPFGLSATASSGLAVSFVSTTAPVCTVSGTTVTLVEAGTCTVKATQAGNVDYAAATAVYQSFTVHDETQTITFPAIPATLLLTGSITLSATASSGLPVSYASTTASVCAISGSTATLLASGTCTIDAKQPGDSGYDAATWVVQSFAVTRETPTITWPTPAAITYGTALSATQLDATSTIAGTFVYTPAAGTVPAGGSQTLSVTLTPTNTTDYTTATATVTLTVKPASQTITFPTIAAVTYGAAPFSLSATASSGLAVGFASTTAPVCTVSAATVTLVEAGTCTIKATQAGSGDYTAATAVYQSFEVHTEAQTITFPAIPSTALSAGSLTLDATATSGLAVSYTSTTTSVCTVSGSTATLVAAGTCTIEAKQPGNGGYGAAAWATQSFKVTAD